MALFVDLVTMHGEDYTYTQYKDALCMSTAFPEASDVYKLVELRE